MFTIPHILRASKKKKKKFDSIVFSRSLKKANKKENYFLILT